MQSSVKYFIMGAIVALGAGCTSGNGALEPPFTSVNLHDNKLQLAVGVATFSDGTAGLNAVATFRQPNGLSATLLNTPTLTGPFTVPAAASAGTDAGTNHITGSPQALPGTVPAVTTFGQSGGVFAYGFAPDNSTTSGAPHYGVYTQAFYGTAALTGGELRGGPPAYPTTTNGLFDPAFTGYTLGFTTFAMAPVAGAYNLSVNIPSGNNPGATITAPTATLTSTVGLPAFAAPPAFVEDGAGGGTATCTPPAGTTETLVEFVDNTTAAGVFYTVVVPGGGAVTATLPDNLGPTKTSATTPSIPTGDSYFVECIAADYPLFEAGPPGNTQQTPTITGPTGQSDIAFSPQFVPASGAYASTRRPMMLRHRQRTTRH